MLAALPAWRQCSVGADVLPRHAGAVAASRWLLSRAILTEVSVVRRGAFPGTTLTPALLADFRDTTGVDLAAAVRAGGTPHALFDEPERLVMLLWLACEGQAAARGIEPEEFGRTAFVEPPGSARRPARPAPGLPRGFRVGAYQDAATAAFRALAALHPDTPFALWVRATGGRRR